MGKNALDLESLVSDPREEIVRRWDRQNFLEGIESSTVKTNTALVLENQFNYLTESGGTSVADISVLKKLTIPMVRRVFPGLIAHDTVAVQPMSGPVGLAYALRRHRINQDGGVEYYEQDTGDTDYPSAATRFADIYADMDYTKPQQDWLGPVSTWAAERQGSDHKLFDTIRSDQNRTEYPLEEVGISIFSKEIRAWSRKLRARFPIEVQQDLHAMHNVDIRRELTDAMSYEITAEIDQEILAAIKHTAKKGGVMSWTYNSTADGRWQIEKYRTLLTAVNLAANEIAVANRMAAGNFIIASPRVCAILEALPEFKLWETKGSLNALGSQYTQAKIGTIGRFAVYRDIFAGGGNGRGSVFQEEYIVVGYKGKSNNDAGIIYAPYVPVQFDEAKGPESFHTHLGVMTRYAIVSNMFGSENYYRYISVDFTGDIADSNATSPAGDPFANYETLPQADGPEYQDS
jgi:hypothetical protein